MAGRGLAGWRASDDEMHKVVIIGEAVAIAATVMCMLSVFVDLGRPDRFWHMIPGIGRFNWPMSMLTLKLIVSVFLGQFNHGRETPTSPGGGVESRS